MFRLAHGNIFLSLGAGDFSVVPPSSVTFSGPPMVQCITINLINDLEVEGTESFTVQISNFGGANMGTLTSCTVNILDNDGKCANLCFC